MTGIPANAIDRIREGSELVSLVEDATTVFGLGRVSASSVIEMGYEDCNVDVTTDRGRYVLKVFATARTPMEIHRYVEIIEQVFRARIAHPPIHTQQDGHSLFVHPATGNRLIAMDYIDGHNYMELKRPPSINELTWIVEQAARINTLDLRPSFLFDSWAVPNMGQMIERVASFIGVADRKLVEQAFEAVQDAHAERLPHAFVHGDISKTNVVLPHSGQPSVLDFAVANVYPRIQEIAVIAANLLHDGTTPLRERVDTVATAYGAFSPLTSEERRALDGYALGAVAMEFLGSLKEIHFNDNSGEETRYWLELGRSGLRSATQEFGLI